MVILRNKGHEFPGGFIAVLTAVLLVVATEGAVTLYNPAKIPVEVLVDGKSLKVASDIMSMDITRAEQKIHITTPMGGLMSVDVKDGDVLLILPGVSNASAVKVVPDPGGSSGDFDQNMVDSALLPDFDRYGPG